MRTKLGNKGIALLLVLSAIAVITTAVTEFSYNTNVNYHLALNERDRLQAYYLAKSSYRFMLLELKFDRVFRSMVKRYNLGQYMGGSVQLPLCQQFPLSTSLLRGIFLGGGLSGLMGGEGEGADGEEGEAPEQEITESLSMSAREEAGDFLGFEGDFDGECFDDSTKISLNGFYDLSVEAPVGKISALDKYKLFVLQLLDREEYKKYFPEDGLTKSEIVDNIADWVDKDKNINRKGGGSAGSESSIYERENLKYPVKSGKLLSLDESYLIQGVVTKWFNPVSENLTVYGDGKINPCTSDQSLMETLVLYYINVTPGLPPIKADDKETMDQVITAMREPCELGMSGDDLITKVAGGFASALGASSAGEVTPTTITNDFRKLLTADTRFFSLKLNGTVAKITMRIKAVVDIKESNPSNWKILYWRIN